MTASVKTLHDEDNQPHWMHPEWPRNEFDRPKRIWDMSESELDRAAKILGPTL